jgi:hypothetical protein
VKSLATPFLTNPKDIACDGGDQSGCGDQIIHLIRIAKQFKTFAAQDEPVD